MEVEGPSMWVGRGVSIWAEDERNLLEVLRGGRTWRLFSSVVNTEVNRRVAREKGYCFEDLLLRVVGWKELETRAEKAVGWNVKPSRSHVQLPICFQAYPFRCHEVCWQEVISA